MSIYCLIPVNTSPKILFYFDKHRIPAAPRIDFSVSVLPQRYIPEIYRGYYATLSHYQAHILEFGYGCGDSCMRG